MLNKSRLAPKTKPSEGFFFSDKIFGQLCQGSRGILLVFDNFFSSMSSTYCGPEVDYSYILTYLSL